MLINFLPKLSKNIFIHQKDKNDNRQKHFSTTLQDTISFGARKNEAVYELLDSYRTIYQEAKKDTNFQHQK